MSLTRTLRDRIRALALGREAGLAPRASRTFVCVDVAHFATLIEALGEPASLAVMRHVTRIVRHHMRRFGGRELELRGDCSLLAFRSAPAALRFSVEVQRAMAAEALPASAQIALRVAVHTGEVIREGGRFFGRNVILTFRLLEQTDPGEILISSQVRPHVPHCWRHCLTTERRFRPRGLHEELRFTGVEWTRALPDPSGFLGEGIRPDRQPQGARSEKFEILTILGGAR